MFDESVSSRGSSNNTNETCFSIGKINSNINQIRLKILQFIGLIIQKYILI